MLQGWNDQKILSIFSIFLCKILQEEEPDHFLLLSLGIKRGEAISAGLQNKYVSSCLMNISFQFRACITYHLQGGRLLSPPRKIKSKDKFESSPRGVRGNGPPTAVSPPCQSMAQMGRMWGGGRGGQNRTEPGEGHCYRIPEPLPSLSPQNTQISIKAEFLSQLNILYLPLHTGKKQPENVTIITKQALPH